MSEIGLLKEALRSWFMIGRMGGFKSANTQVRRVEALEYERLNVRLNVT